MKLRNIILFAVVALLVSSCDFLDKMPDDQKTMDMVWKTEKRQKPICIVSIHNCL